MPAPCVAGDGCRADGRRRVECVHLAAGVAVELGHTLIGGLVGAAGRGRQVGGGPGRLRRLWRRSASSVSSRCSPRAGSRVRCRLRRRPRRLADSTGDVRAVARSSVGMGVVGWAGVQPRLERRADVWRRRALLFASRRHSRSALPTWVDRVGYASPRGRAGAGPSSGRSGGGSCGSSDGRLASQLGSTAVLIRASSWARRSAPRRWSRRRSSAWASASGGPAVRWSVVRSMLIAWC